MLQSLQSVWAYRGFVLGNVKREFQLKCQALLVRSTKLSEKSTLGANSSRMTSIQKL